MPFKELSALEYWSRDDQIWRMSDALMNQFPRHCFIKIHNQKTQPMLVPFVRSYFLSPRNLVRYTGQLYAKQRALPAAQVDRLIEERQQRLLVKARASAEDFSPEQPKSKRRARPKDDEPNPLQEELYKRK